MARGPRTPSARSTRAAEEALPSAARALLAGVLALLALRVLAALLPGRWLWGVDLGRDLARTPFVLPLLLTALLCVPAVARRVAAWFPRDGAAATALAVVLAAALAAFAWTHPDRALYTGDTSLRHGAFARLSDPTPLAAQALKGDLLLHHALPRAMAEHTPFSSEQTGRAQGALLAFATALVGWRLARAAGARGALAFAVMAVAVGTGALALDNGYAKASVELCLLTSLLALALVHGARDGGGLGTAGAAVALALLLHRSALSLLPAYALAAVWAFRAGRLREPRALAGLVAPLVALAVVAQPLVRVIGGYDAQHHAAAGGIAATLAAAFAPQHLLDVLHVLALLVPLAPLLPLLVALAPRASGRESLAALALLGPPLALLGLVLPQHGLARDWDVYAFAGAGVAAFLAWRLARVLAAPAAHGVALAVALAALVPALQWAALQSDAERTWARAEGILMGPPLRGDSERADALGTIGMMHFGRGRYAEAKRLFERSAAAAPNPRTFVEWGMAEAMLGDHAAAMARYREAAARNPQLATAWRGIAAAASALGDRAAMAEAVSHLEQLEPGSETVQQARAWLLANPGR